MMNDLFNLTNCYQDDNYYYFFRALNKRDMTGIRNGSILDSDGHINKIVTDSTFYNHKERYNEESNLTLEEMINHVKTRYDKDTNCISLSSDANVCLTYGRNDYEDKYIVVKVPKNELGVTTFNAGKYIYEEVSKRVNAYIEEHQSQLTDLQKYYISALDNITTKDQLDNLKKTLPEEYANTPDEKFQNGLDFITSKPYEGYSQEENLAKDKLVMLLDVLDFEVVKGKTNRLVIQTMGSAFSSRELEYYQEVPGNKIVEMPTSLVEIMALIQQVPETDEVKEIKNYLLTHLDEVRQNTKELDYSRFNPEDLDLSLDNLYTLTEGKISYRDAKELYLNSMYLVRSKLRTFYSVNLLNNILGNNQKYYDTLQSILDNALGIEPSIMNRDSSNEVKLSDTVRLNLSKRYQSLYTYVNTLKFNNMDNLFKNPTESFNTLFSKYVSNKELKPQDREEWYANGLIDSIDLESLNLKTNFNQSQRRKIVNALVSHNFMDYYEKAKTLSDDGTLATSMFASLVANRKEFTNDSSIILDQLKDYIGYNTLKEYNLPLRKLQRKAYTKTNEILAHKNFAVSVMPTGSGKSFLALSEMLDRKNEHMLYIAPNDIILNQIENYIYEFFGYTDYHTLFPNLTLTTYQDLKDKKTNKLKEKYSGKYDFIILDELHRSGAPEWQAFVNELMANQDKEKIKVLGLTATPERDRDDKDMSVYWARYFGCTDEEIELNRHLAVNETLESAIKAGLLPNPKVVNPLYVYKSDGTLDEMYERINMIDDEEKKAKAFSKYEQLCRSVEQSSGIEKILADNLDVNGKYVVFLPVGRSKDGTYYNSEDGSKISKVQATQILENYMILIRQYLYSNEYMKSNGNTLLTIYNKIVNKQELSSEDKAFLTKEQDNIMLLDMIKIKHKPAALNTFNSELVNTIARHMSWEKLDEKTLKERIEAKTKDMLDTNSLLSYYSNSKNKEELNNFNKEPNGKPKLLFVMDKLNEGAHLKGVKGIVWLRPLSVNSRILFYQQLGRCIHSYPDGHVFTEEERPIVLDLVNNINTVNLKREQSPINDLEDLKIIIDWINDNGGKLPNKNSGILEEKNYGLKLDVILYRYIKYFNNPKELNNIKNKRVIEKILRLGSGIDLWNIKIDEATRQRKVKESEEQEEKFLQGFLQVESSVSDFINLEHEINELASPETNFDKIFNYLCILKNKGIDINKILREDKLKIIKIDDNYTIQIIKMKRKYENSKVIVINKQEYNEPGLINIGYYVNAFRKGKANNNLSSSNLSGEQISRLKTLDFVFNQKVDPILKPESFNDYVELLKKLKASTGRDINDIKQKEIVKIAKINNEYKFEFFENDEETKMRYGENQKTVGIGYAIYYFKRGQNTSKKDLEDNQIKQLEDPSIGLKVKLETERDKIMNPKSFDDYVKLLTEMQNAKDKTGRDINSIKCAEVLKITKINDNYMFEYFENRKKAKETYGEDVDTIRIGQIINCFKRGKNSSGKKVLEDYQIKQLEDPTVGLKVILEKERDPIMNPKCFDDYVDLLRALQNVKDKTGRDINSIKSTEAVRITKINTDYLFEYFDNREEAEKKYGKTVETIGIGNVICSFKRGKNSSRLEDLNPSQIKQLEDPSVDLKVKLEKERDHIMEPKSFDDYVLLLKRLQNKKNQTGYDINDIKDKEVVKITKINDDYVFEYLANREEAKKKYGEAVGIIGIGSVICSFKRGKNSSRLEDLNPSQIKQLEDPSVDLKVKLEKERDHIMEPKSFDDYVLLLKKLQENKIDINAIKGPDRMKITKNVNDYYFQIIHQYWKKINGKLVTANTEEYGQDDLILIGRKINYFKNGKYSPITYLTMDQMNTLLSIGFKFKKGIEDLIYKQEMCKSFNIDLKINEVIINRTSKIELQSKIKFLASKGISPVDNSGKLIDIFSMSSSDIENDPRYGMSLDTIINTYGKGKTRK